jgi:hypothetical protein
VQAKTDELVMVGLADEVIDTDIEDAAATGFARARRKAIVLLI